MWQWIGCLLMHRIHDTAKMKRLLLLLLLHTFQHDAQEKKRPDNNNCAVWASHIDVNAFIAFILYDFPFEWWILSSILKEVRSFIYSFVLSFTHSFIHICVRVSVFSILWQIKANMDREKKADLVFDIAHVDQTKPNTKACENSMK